jgi:hypothetical protein
MRLLVLSQSLEAGQEERLKVSKTDEWDVYMRTEGWKEYHIIECYQYISDELDRAVAIRAVEASRKPDEAKAVIAKARGLVEK